MRSSFLPSGVNPQGHLLADRSAVAPNGRTEISLAVGDALTGKFALPAGAVKCG
jgi:hypothetical protein